MTPFKPCLLFVTVFTGLLLTGQETISQEEIKFTPIPSLFNSDSVITFTSNFYAPTYNYISQDPDKQDKRNFNKYKYLLTQQPTNKNYKKYYSLACSLWELNKLKEAETLFLNIINSTEEHYSATWYHNSDVPGDTTRKLYGYGSYTSSYKNSAAIYLTEIYITNKQFDKALLYMDEATKKYKVTYTCGTGYYMKKSEYDFLYACCYEGLQKYDAVLDLLLPDCLSKDDAMLIRVIKDKYKPDEIKNYLSVAEASLQFQLDTLLSYTYMPHYGKSFKEETTDTLAYYSGTATINLFGRTVEIPRPYNLQNGEKATKELFLKRFKECPFYTTLAQL